MNTTILAIAIAQWLLFAAIAFFSRATSTGRNLIISSVIFAAGWLTALDARSLIHSRHVESRAIASRTSASCSVIDTGMTSADVQSRLGKADQVRSDEEIRGPRAEAWIYRDSRCVVHLFDGKVEFIE